ncbi:MULTISPECIES: surface-adhesin E family protein [unclassified Acinetobacter]|uniref:surface-adhesin E family protein n=1 Tax=unclassified Acinetobacter TaxID=196816 RepID=UPI00124FB149|nr:MULTISPECIES: surface-adhesin E family protein [unclassified Acinetobacter]
MKKLILVFSFIASSLSYGADWKYAAIGGQNDRAIYVDSSQYNYDMKNNSIKAWFKTDSYEDDNSKNIYTRSKNFFQFSCADNKLKLLAYVNYDKKGDVVSSGQSDSKDIQYSMVIPDTIGESLWKVACISKGKGFRYPKYQTGVRLTKEEMDKIRPKDYVPQKQTQEEINEMMKGFDAE